MRLLNRIFKKKKKYIFDELPFDIQVLICYASTNVPIGMSEYKRIYDKYPEYRSLIESL